jgi:hypothetical protein
MVRVGLAVALGLLDAVGAIAESAADKVDRLFSRGETDGF